MDMKEYGNFRKVEIINKGWSYDEKYYIEIFDGEKLLLRISDISLYDTKIKEFEMLKEISKLDIPMNQPLKCGICNGGKSVFLLFKWLDGVDLEENIHKYSEEEQYRLGYDAGLILKKIHSVEISSDLNWEEYFNSKMDKKIQDYIKCPLKYDGDKYILNYIEENRHLLKDRPITFLHGDYHIGNMLVNGKDELGIIDFNRCSYGDPWEEFNRIVWCASASPHFASGRINRYFDMNLPEEFFRLLALYICSNTLSSLPWAMSVDKKQIPTMLAQANEILIWFNNMKNPIPNWYIEK